MLKKNNIQNIRKKYMKYYIYHIPNIKIGVSKTPKYRVTAQGYSDYEILEEHTCINTVSKREIELQKQYGYKVDKLTYKTSCLNSPFAELNKDSKKQSKALQAAIKKNSNHQSDSGKIGGKVAREKCGHLTMEQAQEIRSLFKKGYTYNQLAEKYGVKYHTIWRTIKNIRYT